MKQTKYKLALSNLFRGSQSNIQKQNFLLNSNSQNLTSKNILKQGLIFRKKTSKDFNPIYQINNHIDKKSQKSARDQNQHQNKYNHRNPFRHLTNTSTNIKFQNKNKSQCLSIDFPRTSRHKSEKRLNQQGKNCRIILQFNKNQDQYYFEMTNFKQLNQFLKQITSNEYYFKTAQGNLALDYMITQEKLSSNFLNGKTIYLKPIKKMHFNARQKISLKHFQILKPVGSGGFSKVFLCRFRQDGQFYALKLIDKQMIVKHKKKKIIMNERNIMKNSKHPFIVEMKFAFESQNHLAFVLQYCAGGQLFGLIKKSKRITENTAKFYIIELLLGLAYLHQNNVVYRDIKPQNILLNIDGHVKIADLGLAKPDMGNRQMAYSFCGSPQYMSPQMILQQGHTFPVDHYCTGALLYELLIGLPPFYSRNPNQIYQAVLSEQLSFPDDIYLSDQCKNLLKGLLCKDSRQRLGSIHGIKQILAHPWFGKNIYKKYLQKLIDPPVNFQGLQKINLTSVPKQVTSQDLNKVLRQQIQGNIYFKPVMKNFYYDYRIEGMQKQQKIQSLLQNQLKLRRKSNGNVKQKILALNSQRSLTKKYSTNKFLENLSTRR